MRNPNQKRLWLLLVVMFISPACFAAAEEYIPTLEYIAEGYKANNDPRGTLVIKGRIFHEQKAAEGREIDPARIYGPKWLSYKYMQKEGKRRYEQDRTSNPKQPLCVLDNDKRIAAYTPGVIRIFPIRDEESYWLDSTDLYGDFSYLLRNKNYMNVYFAMKTLIQSIRNGVYDGETAVLSLSEEEGLFVIRTTEDGFECKFEIDSKKGFNLVGVKIYCPDPEFYREYVGKYDFKELDTGQWILISGLLRGEENGVVFEKRLETDTIETDIDLPDDLFEIDSLNLPPDIYTIDYHFSPPLEFHTIDKPNAEELDNLLEADRKGTEIAEIKKSKVTIQKDLAVEKYQEEHKHSMPKSEKERARFAFLFLWLLSGTLLAGSLIAAYRISHKKK